MPNWFNSDVLATVLLLVFVFQFKRISSFINLLKVRLRPAQWSPVDADVLPDYLLELFSCAEVELKDLGFEKILTQASAPINMIDPRTHIFSALYWHPQQSVLARVEQASAVSGQIMKVQFLTIFSDGKALLTTNREQWEQLPVADEIKVVDSYADDLASQWHFHEQHLTQELTQHAIMAEQEAVLQQANTLECLSWSFCVRKIGWCHEYEKGRYRLTARGAWRYARQLSQIPTEVRRALLRPYSHKPQPEPHNARLAEMDTIGTILALAAEPSPAWVKAGLFVLTLMASAILFGYGFGLMSAAALLAVLFIHELGHLAAMWLFNYRNLSIFFLPFIGAAASGHKPEASPWQEASVLLSGPVIGLIAALMVSQIPSDNLPLVLLEFARSFVFFGVVLNLFNLIPIGVLDGGRLFELAVLGRFPYARTVFSTIGMVVGLSYAVWSQSFVFGFVMLLLMLGIPLQFKAARIISAIHQRRKKLNQPSLTPAQSLQALAQEFATGNYGATGSQDWSQRVTISRLVYPRLLQGTPHLTASIGILLIHLSVIVVTLVLVVWLGWRNPAPLMTTTTTEQQSAQQKYSAADKAAKDAIIEQFNAANDPVAKWEILEQLDEDEFYDWGWIEQQRAILRAQLPVDHVGKLREKFYHAPDNPSNLLAIISTLTANNTRQFAELDDGKRSLLLDVYQQLSVDASIDIIQQHLPTLKILWEKQQSDQTIQSQLASILAHMTFKMGDIEAAQSFMNQYQQTGGKEAYYHATWFLLDVGQPQQALDRAEKALTMAAVQGDVDPSFLNGMMQAKWQTLAGWAEMSLGHQQRAESHFKAVLAQRQQRLEDNRQTQALWLRLLSQFMAKENVGQKWLDEETLDHLVVLNINNPIAAKEQFNALNKQRLPYIQSTVDGWGKIRAEAHQQLLAALNSTQSRPK